MLLVHFLHNSVGKLHPIIHFNSSLCTFSTDTCIEMAKSFYKFLWRHMHSCVRQLLMRLSIISIGKVKKHSSHALIWPISLHARLNVLTWDCLLFPLLLACNYIAHWFRSQIFVSMLALCECTWEFAWIWFIYKESVNILVLFMSTFIWNLH